MLNTFFYLLIAEIKMTFRQAYTWLTPILFFIIINCLFALGTDTNPERLALLAPSVIWVSALLSLLISIDNLFQEDANLGYLEQLILSPHPLTSLVLIKILSHWLTHCLPLILISPLLGFLLHLRPYEIEVLVVTLLLGTPVLILLGAMGAALVTGIRHAGLLLPVLVMPLYIPVLIFGTSTVWTASLQQPVMADLAWMGALLLLTFAFAPYFTSMALRIGVNQ